MQRMRGARWPPWSETTSSWQPPTGSWCSAWRSWSASSRVLPPPLSHDASAAPAMLQLLTNSSTVASCWPRAARRHPT
jgi:hypothetical protein